VMAEELHFHKEPEQETQAEPSSVPETPAVEESQDVLSLLKQELAELLAQRDEYLDGWQRAVAEFVNYKKRIEREREQMHQNAVGNVVRHYLDVVDDLNRALKNRPAQGDGAKWADGIELIYRKLLTNLEAEGVTLIEGQGQPFDPNRHEAISQEPNADHESGAIIEVVQNGYLLGERVLRPARVRVAQ